MNDTMTLAVSGEISLGSLARATGRFHRLVAELTVENAPSSGIDWIVDDLQQGCVITTVRGQGNRPRSSGSSTHSWT